MQIEYFNDLKKLYYKNLLNLDFNENDFNKIEFEMRTEYKSLKDHIQAVLNTLKGKNESVIVHAKQLQGRYTLKPLFKKIVQKSYIYTQINLQEFNDEKKAIYKGQIVGLDNSLSLSSVKRLDINSLFPFIGNKPAEGQVAFKETECITEPTKNSSDDIIANKCLYTLYNYSNDDEYEVSLDDIRQLMDQLEFTDVNIYQQGLDFVTDKMIESKYFDCELTENQRSRVYIESFDIKEKALDDIDYFFEELEGKFYVAYDFPVTFKEEIIIKKRDRSQQVLIIEKKDQTEFINPIQFLVFEISLSNLIKQLKVLNMLINKPKSVNKNLIKIIYSGSVFSNPIEYSINKYTFLNDLSYQGTDEQRSFVKKALSTDDFMILSGPPGTGKTTAIMEFIIQAIKKNPNTKILLSASTHIAIDNVLENLITYFKNELYKINFFPIRVGTSDTISSMLDEYSYEKIKEKYNPGVADLYLLSSNLICGTTMGISRYLDNLNMEFEYLIIDEASKTTLQEFIVPASMAEKFIIVGDVNQLSPYTDTFMLETILKSNDKLNSQIEDQAYNFYVLNQLKESQRDLFIVVINSQETVRVMSKWFNDQSYSFILNNQSIDLLYYQKNIVIWKKLYKDWISFIPSYFKHIYTVEEQPDYIKLKMPDTILDFSDRLETIRENADNKIGSNWAREVAWRYVRFHELKKNDKKYERELDWLIPDQIKNIKDEIDQLSDITIPSVLIKLQEGVKSRNTKNIKNRFRTGFSIQEKESRFVQLVYQHRMHREIARYAESSIYEGLLKTARTVDISRSNLNIYPHHSIMIDVKCKKMCKSENEQEAIEITRIVKHIIEKTKNEIGKIKIGILTFYKAQERVIKNYMRDMLKQYNVEMYNTAIINNLFIEVYTVDKFQGKESDISIISLSRNKGLGFMNVPNRINVAMTRAKYYRIVVGDADHFRTFQEPFLKNIVNDSICYKEGELL
jgi:DNA polymerase III delta prime subunit